MLGGLSVSTAMAVQDQCGGSELNSVFPAENGVSLKSGLHVVTGPLLKEQFSCGNDFSPKARKPYTITKQRERWTEEEHKKFLEALKLYGRAWRRIEEHVGSKTAVQIRSHAQKFFSKVERESSGTTTIPAEPIEIPPPRPKRKPVHPYPRKMVHPLNKEASTSEHSSPNLSISDHENQSPTSVLSLVCSDALGSTDSNTPNCSLSPVSCAGGSHSADLSVSEINLTLEDDERSPKKLSLFLKEEETSTRSLKLFGRTVLITECNRNGPVYQTVASSKSLPSCTNEKSDPAEKTGFPAEESDFSATRPWWAVYTGLLFPLGLYPKQETVKVILDSSEEFQEKDIQKERSWTGSNSGSVNEEENTESECHTCNPILELKPIERSGSSNNCMKGFVPYKRHAAERDNQSATLTSGELERDEKRVRLCL